jgi:CheY-like chemotaxis protein
VEDDPGDALLLRRALQRSRLAARLQWLEDGEQALTYLRRQDPFHEAMRPDLVLMDLNMPKKDGHSVLAEIRRDPHLQGLPVMILTTSRAEEDVARSYELHANAYVSKPVGLDGYHTVLESIEGFWFTVVILPPRPPRTGGRR